MICTKCKGTTREPRQAPYNDANLYPFLAATEGNCEHCDGSGYEPYKTARQIAVEAAKKAAGD